MAFRPIIYTSQADVFGGIVDGDMHKFGALGEPEYITFHHSAGPRARDKATAQRLNRAYLNQHIDQGWGWIGYHFGMDDHGRIYKFRDVSTKGAHTGGHNSRNIGIMVHGNYDHDRLTWRQYRTLRWLFRGGFYILTGEPEDGFSLVRGHQEWPGPTNATACPGKALMRHVRYRRNTDMSGAS